MEKEYKILEELQKIYKNIEFDIEQSNIVEQIKWLRIKGLYTIDKNTIKIIEKYSEDYYIDTNYKKVGLIINIQIWKN